MASRKFYDFKSRERERKTGLWWRSLWISLSFTSGLSSPEVGCVLEIQSGDQTIFNSGWNSSFYGLVKLWQAHGTRILPFSNVIRLCYPFVCVCIYIYIYMSKEREWERKKGRLCGFLHTIHPFTFILFFSPPPRPFLFFFSTYVAYSRTLRSPYPYAWRENAKLN